MDDCSQGPQHSSPAPEEASAARSQQRSSGKIPVITLLDGSAPAGPVIAASADGAAIRLRSLQHVAADLGAQAGTSPTEQVGGLAGSQTCTCTCAAAVCCLATGMMPV